MHVFERLLGGLLVNQTLTNFFNFRLQLPLLLSLFAASSALLLKVFYYFHVSLSQLLPVWSVQDRNRAPVTGSIVEIAQPGGVRGELHPVLVSLPADTLEPGEPVEVGITPRETVATTVPLLSVMTSNGGDSVFRISDGVARRVPVTVQRIIGERVVVDAADLDAGDQVVFAGMTRISDGDAVEVR